MTNEAKEILHRLHLQDHVKAVREAKVVVDHLFPTAHLGDDLRLVVEYLQAQLDKSPEQGTIEA